MQTTVLFGLAQKHVTQLHSLALRGLQSVLLRNGLPFFGQPMGC